MQFAFICPYFIRFMLAYTYMDNGHTITNQVIFLYNEEDYMKL